MFPGRRPRSQFRYVEDSFLARHLDNLLFEQFGPFDRRWLGLEEAFPQHAPRRPTAKDTTMVNTVRRIRLSFLHGG